MPSGMHTIDAGLPKFTGTESTEDKVNAIQNYLFMLQEELHYVLHNLGSENINENSLNELKTEITKVGLDGIRARVSNAEGDISALTQTASSLAARITNAEGDISALELTASGLTTRVSNAEGDISALELTASGILAQIADASGNYTVLNLKPDGLHIGNASGTTTIAGSSINAASLTLTDNISFNNVSGTASAAASAASTAQSTASAIAAGTYSGGSFIDGRHIYSPEIYTNLLTIQPDPNQSVSGFSGGLLLKGKFGATLYDMLRVYFYAGDAATIIFDSPSGGYLRMNFPISYINGTVYLNDDIRPRGEIVLRENVTYGTTAPTGMSGEDGQLYFQIAS